MGKYGSNKVIFENRSFASKLEAALYAQLRLREKAGEIKDIATQVKVYLTAARIGYIADFCFFDSTLNQPVWAEAKGYPTESWAIKKRLWSAGYGPGRLEIYTGSHLRLRMTEVVVSTLPKGYMGLV